MEQFLSRWNRYKRRGDCDGQRLSNFAVALAMWREYTQAEIKPPLLTKLSVYQRALLETRFAESEEVLEELLDRPPRISEVAAHVATRYKSRDVVRASAVEQVRELLLAAEKHEYWSGVPAQWIPYTGLRVTKASAEAFWRWYNATFHA
jgi:hypothetical protein